MNKMRLSFAAVIAAASVALTGCGKSTTYTTAAPSKAAMYVPLTAENLGTKQLAAAQKATSMHMTMTMGSMVTAQGDVAGPPLRMKMTMHVTQGANSVDLSMVYANDAFFINTPDLPSGKFHKMDANTPGFGQFIGLIKNMTPENMAKAVAAGLVSVNYDGPVTIDGTTTHHYTVVVDAIKSAAAMGADPSLVAEMKKVATGPITEEVFLNEDNTPRRMVMPLPSVGTMEANFSNWNETVDIQAPAAADVVTK